MSFPAMLQYANNPVEFARQVLRFQPDPVQVRLLETSASRGILCCTRQWGKSTTTAIKAAHHAFFRADSLVLAAAPTARQSAELVRKCAAFLQTAGVRRRGDGQNAISLLLPNGARIVGLPGNEDNIRGFSAPSLVLIDEAARVPDSLYHALLPMLATSSNGQLWIMSTPNGKQGFFYDEWHGANEAERVSVSAHECPRITKSFLEAEAARMPRHVFDQEYHCVFTARQDALFSDGDIESALFSQGRSL